MNECCQFISTLFMSTFDSPRKFRIRKQRTGDFLLFFFQCGLTSLSVHVEQIVCSSLTCGQNFTFFIRETNRSYVRSTVGVSSVGNSEGVSWTPILFRSSPFNVGCRNRPLIRDLNISNHIFKLKNEHVSDPRRQEHYSSSSEVGRFFRFFALAATTSFKRERLPRRPTIIR